MQHTSSTLVPLLKGTLQQLPSLERIKVLGVSVATVCDAPFHQRPHVQCGQNYLAVGMSLLEEGTLYPKYYMANPTQVRMAQQIRVVRSLELTYPTPR